MASTLPQCNKALTGVSEHNDAVVSEFCPAVLRSPSDWFCFCISPRMTMRVALALQAAVSQTPPRLWPSPAAFSRLPLVTRTCHQVSDSPGASKPLPPPRLENGNKGRNYLCGGGIEAWCETAISNIYATGKCFISYTEKSYRGKNLLI